MIKKLDFQSQGTGIDLSLPNERSSNKTSRRIQPKIHFELWHVNKRNNSVSSQFEIRFHVGGYVLHIFYCS